MSGMNVSENSESYKLLLLYLFIIIFVRYLNHFLHHPLIMEIYLVINLVECILQSKFFH